MLIGQDPEFFTIDQLKEVGLWPYTFLPAYGIIPYINRIKSESIIGAEVGSLKGESAFTLLEFCPKISKLYVIDHFEGHKDYELVRTQEDMEKHEKILRHNLVPYSNRYELIKEDSVEGSKKIQSDILDFVLIDGDHTTEGIRRDLDAYYPLVKSKGYVFVHNCNSQTVMNGIKKYREDNKIRLPINTSKNFVCFWIKK